MIGYFGSGGQRRALGIALVIAIVLFWTVRIRRCAIWLFRSGRFQEFETYPGRDFQVHSTYSTFLAIRVQQSSDRRTLVAPAFVR